MPIVTVQLGQCGNQLGASWFDTLAEELSSGVYGAQAAETYFQQLDAPSTAPPGFKQWAARAVMIDMEPKVIYSAKQRAASSPYGWKYAANSAVSGQSGSGNNWALGHNKYGPLISASAKDLVRRQVEACDVFEGFLMLQSMAGGTGAGAGTFLTEMLTDEYDSAQILNCCVWPYSSGEVTVQPYNTLLSLSNISEVSSGIVMLQNEVLHETCTRRLGLKHPGFKDLNSVAARGLAGALLYSRPRPVSPAAPTPPATDPTGSSSSRHSSRTSTSRGTVGGGTDGSSSWPTKPGQCEWTRQGSEVLSGPAILPIHPLADLSCHLFSHPSYQLASVRSVPQLATTSMEYTTFSWPAILRRLKAMCLAGVYLDEGLSSYMPGPSSGGSVALPLHKYKNRAVSSMLVLRGNDAGSVPVKEFDDAHMYSGWSVDPLLVAADSAKFAGCQMAATLLSTDQACVAPLHAMQSKAYSMLSARAYVHQYEAYGLEQQDFEQCFSAIEDIMAAYASLGDCCY